MYDNAKLQEHLRDERFDLTPMEKFVALMLTTYRNRQNGECFPSQQRIALRCGISRQHVNGLIKSLKQKRVLDIRKSRFNDVRKKTITNYVFLFDKSL